MLMLCSTCFGHHYAHHQEITTIALVTSSRVAVGWKLTPNQQQLENQTACVVTKAIVVIS